MKNTIKAMTFNLRYENDRDGINSFTNRAPKILSVIESESPDIVGFQEVTDNMRKYLRDNCREYTFFGCGRDKNYRGESMIVGCKSDSNEVISMENFWLSPSPDVPGSRFMGDQSMCPRMATVLFVKNADTEKPFYFVNTHLDCAGPNARFYGAMELMQKISGFGAKFILTGDFNAHPDAPEIKLVTEALSERHITDCTKDVPPTFHGFGKLSGDSCEKIDYIFTDGICIESHAVPDTPKDGIYYSDHNAVTAVIDLS